MDNTAEQINTSATTVAVLNDTNVLLTQLMTKILQAKKSEQPVGQDAYLEMIEVCNDVMTRLVVLSGHHQKLLTQSQAEQPLSDNHSGVTEEMMHEHGALQQQIADTPVNEKSLPEILEESIDRINGFVERISDNKKKTYSIENILSNESVFFDHISPFVVEGGKGGIKPCEFLDSYFESVLDTPVEDLVNYREGFYNIDLGKEGYQLYFKTSNTDQNDNTPPAMEFVWVFRGGVKAFFVRTNAQWMPIQTLSQSMVVLFVTAAVRRLKELSEMCGQA